MISICLATHNGGKYINEQLDSILPQLGDNDEIIVSDDGSTDDTIDRIKSYNDPRIKIYHYKQPPFKKAHKNFIYAARNFENALKHSKGDYIFLCDQDDIWNKDKIRIMLPYLKKYDCVHHGKYDMFTDGSPLMIHRSMPYERDIIRALIRMRFSGCCMGFTRRLLDKALPMPHNLPTHDGWLACMAVANNSYYYISDPLIQHRIHGNNVSYMEAHKTDAVYSIKYRLRIIAYLLKRGFLKKAST